MSDSVETALTRTLTEAAEAAPAPPVDLIHNVDTGFRRRRRRRHSLIAAVAVFAVVTGSAIWAGNTFRPQPDPKPTAAFEPVPPAPLPSLPAAKPPPVTEVWPQAYHEIPARLPDGRKLTPQDFVTDHLVLATTDASPEHADRLWIVDARTGRSRVLADLPKPHPDPAAFASHFTVGSGHVVWWDSYFEGGRYHTRVWKVPLAGGRPEQIATAPDSHGTVMDQLVVRGDTVYLASSMRPGIWKAPLDGGDAQMIRGTESYQLVSWPWAGRPIHCMHGAPQAVPCPTVPIEYRRFTELLNLETGDRRGVTVPEPNLEAIVCGVGYCFAAIDNEPRRFLFTRDGRLSQELTRSASILRDRFLMYQPRGSGTPRLYDLKTGTYGELTGFGGPAVKRRYLANNSRMITWSTANKRSYAILDLAAIEKAG